MKTFTQLCCLITLLFAISFVTAQTTPVKITVDWEVESYKNKVEIYDQANNLVFTICNSNECFQTSGTEEIYTGTYDLGCIQDGNYYLKLYNADTGATSWADGYVTVDVNGAVPAGFPYNGGTVNDGTQYPFTVTSDGTPCNSFTDTDGDGVIDIIDVDDDNDGIPDVDEGLGINTFNCTIPALNFKDNVLESGTAGQVGAIYRFPNAIFGEPYDVLVEITEKHDDATLANMDNDAVDNENYLQTEITFTDNETPADCPTCDYPGITFKFTIVDAGTSVNATSLFSIGGTTWDVDGGAAYRESVRYYNPSAYGVDNPTTVQVTDVNGDASEIEMTAGGILEGPGFSTLSQLRSYFQFRLDNTDGDLTNDSFSLRMQNVRTTYTSTSTRQYGMSFTQCDVLDFKAATIVIVNGEDTDGDGIDNQMDIDSDNDGIPDNIEGQPTVGYLAPDFNNVPYVGINPLTGIDTAYDFELVLPDTDGDGIADFLDSDTDGDGTPDIEENGSAFNVLANTDSDGDGLDDNFDDVPGTYDINDEITTGTVAELTTSFLDSDSDIPNGGDLDYRDAIDVYYESATIDFDGVDDYVDSSFDFSGMTQATVMAWIKLDTNFTNYGAIINQGEFLLDIDGGMELSTNINSGYIDSDPADALQLDKWYHIAVIYDNSLASDNLKLYLNGELIKTNSHVSLTNPMSASTDKFTIGKSSNIDSNHFKGAIDEVRVFDIPLTEDQLQQIIYQEIEEISTLVEGKIIPKNIADFTTTTAIPWANLQAYYPMTNIANTRTLDYSNYGRNATLHNITTIQPQTAPMPYKTTADGNWNMGSTWLNGSVWDVQDATVKPWAIYHIQHDITVSSSIKSYGLIIDDAKTLTVTGDNEIRNSWYLELNGTIDLANDSQLVQTSTSDLVTDEDGNILRRQEGNLSYFWYNYWSSPVGATAVTNNTNTDFAINMLKDGSGNAMTFTSAYNETGKISNRWLYKFQNGQTYYDWVALAPNSTIEPGVGYTQKGTNSAVGDQQYIFEGKPNNGTILLNADDIDGDSANEHSNSTGMFNYTSTLIGNPYPSALDAEKFIADNPTVISGAIYVWEQWAGTSHNLHEYEGGYGTINMGSVAPAYQWNDSGLDVSAFVKTPTPYIPVGQGFFVEVVADSGTIEFNNDQRVFKSEDLGESIFFRNSNSENATSTSSEDNPLGLMRLELTVSNGNKRNFVLLFGESATDDFDYGYDARTIDPQQDDLNSFLNDEKMVIQSFAPITNDKVVDLVFNSTGTYNYTIEMIDIENIPEDQEVYLRDNLTNTYFNLRSGAYSFSSEVNAEDTERFDIVFQPGETLGTEEFENDDTVIFVNNTEDMLYVKGLASQAKQLNITNMLGQNIRSYNGMDNQTLENGLNISGLSSGVYLVNVRTENNLTIDKKIIVD